MVGRDITLCPLTTCVGRILTPIRRTGRVGRLWRVTLPLLLEGPPQWKCLTCSDSYTWLISPYISNNDDDMSTHNDGGFSDARAKPLSLAKLGDVALPLAKWRLPLSTSFLFLPTHPSFFPLPPSVPSSLSVHNKWLQGILKVRYHCDPPPLPGVGRVVSGPFLDSTKQLQIRILLVYGFCLSTEGRWVDEGCWRGSLLDLVDKRGLSPLPTKCRRNQEQKSNPRVPGACSTPVMMFVPNDGIWYAGRWYHSIKCSWG